MAGPVLATALSGIPIAGPIIGGFVGGLVDQLWMPKLFGKTKQPARVIDIDMSLATDGTPGTLVYGLWGRVPMHMTWASLPWRVPGRTGNDKRGVPAPDTYYGQVMWLAAQRGIFEFDQLLFEGRRAYTATLDRDVSFTARALGSGSAGATVRFNLSPLVGVTYVDIESTKDGSGDPVDPDLALSLSRYDVSGKAAVVLNGTYYSAVPGGQSSDFWDVIESRTIDANGNGFLRIRPQSVITIPGHWSGLFTGIFVTDGTPVTIDGVNVQYDPKVFPGGSGSVEMKTSGTTASTIISAAIGADNTPIFRQAAYVVTDQLNLSSFGSRFPNASAIVRGNTALLFLDTIVEDLCETWAELEADEFDVTTVPDTSIYGLTVFSPFEPAGELEKLMVAYRLLWQEGSDCTGRPWTRFVNRTERDEVVLDVADFNARRPGEDFTDEPFEVERLDLSERVRKVEVSFRDLDNTWQRGVETDELQHSKAGKEVRIQLDEMTLTRPEGKSIARESLRESWARSKRVEWVGSYLQWDVQEDDVVSWTDADGREWVVVVDEITETADRFLEFVGYAIPREELGVTLTSESSTTGEDPRYDTGQAKTPVGYSPLFVRVFEVPPISDAHVGVPGVYVAITNTDPSVAFGGGVVFVKKPSDATWRPSLVIETPATMGIATDELATVADTTVYDTVASVNVQTWTLAELASVTEAEVDDARNLALIGPEVVGFRDATLESDGTYTLEHLRRGAMGTEAEVGEHLALEEFTLLDANVGFLPLDREDEGTTIEIKVVPPGASLDDVLTIEHEVQLLTCKPVAPAGVELTAVGNTLQVDWTYRSARTVRFRGADFVPREAGERIEIRFYNSTLASKTTPVETVRVDSDLETYTLETPYDSGLTGTDVSAEVVVITDTFGESAAAGDDLTGPGFVTIAPEEVVDFDYVDGTAQAVTGGPVTVETTDRVVAVDANAGAVTVNLPPAASATRIVTVVKVDASVNLVTIDADGAETIDGATTRTLSSQWASVNLISDGTEWFTA